MKTLCAAVLFFEAIVVLLAIPVAIVGVQSVSAPVGVIGGGILVVACFAASGLQRRSWGLTVGWVLQVLVILTGFLVPTMFFLGLVFAVLWFYAIRVGRRGDAIKQARETQGV